MHKLPTTIPVIIKLHASRALKGIHPLTPLLEVNSIRVATPLLSKQSHNLPWHCCLASSNLFIFYNFILSVVSCIKSLCGDMENQPETSLAVITWVKLDRLRKSAIKNQNNRGQVFSKTFLSNLNILVIHYIFFLKEKRGYQSNCLRNMVPVTVQNHKAHRTH